MRAILAMDWARLVELVGRVRATSKKGEKVALIADVLRETRGRETELVALYLTGTLPQGRIGVGWQTLEPALPSGPAQGEPLTLARLDVALSAVAARDGPWLGRSPAAAAPRAPRGRGRGGPAPPRRAADWARCGRGRSTAS